MRPPDPDSGRNRVWDFNALGPVKKWGFIVAVIVAASLAGWCAVSACYDYEASPAGRGTEIEHEAVEICRGAEFAVTDIIKESLADPDSFEWRDGYRLPSRHDLMTGDIGADRIAPFVAYFRHKNR